MLKFFSSCIARLSANAKLVPTHSVDSIALVDLGHYQTYRGYKAFNSAPEIGSFFASLAADHQINTAIETGTWLGYTTSFLSLIFDHVHTIEISEEYYNTAQKILCTCPNVIAHRGSSEKVLRTILPSLQDRRLFFYLDAHWNEFWPLWDELEEISKTHKDNCIIVVDDFKVPGRADIAYDYYGTKEASFAHIRDHLDLVYSEYECFYLIPKDPSCRAKFVAIPRKWKE